MPVNSDSRRTTSNFESSGQYTCTGQQTCNRRHVLYQIYSSSQCHSIISLKKQWTIVIGRTHGAGLHARYYRDDLHYWGWSVSFKVKVCGISGGWVKLTDDRSSEAHNKSLAAIHQDLEVRKCLRFIVFQRPKRLEVAARISLGAGRRSNDATG